MIRGSGTISNYGAYISNCTKRQYPFKIPVTSLSDIQLFIDIGGRPDFAEYQLIHTCGPYAGTIETIIPDSYVIGQKPNDDWYGVFKNFQETELPLSCFVIGITLTFGLLDVIYFSEEYCVDNPCENLTLLKACYGNLDNKISYGCDGVYFGRHATENTPLGDPTVYYQHQTYLRDVDVTLASIKNTFKQGRTRNFRTEKERIFQFWGEIIPEWFIDTIDAIFYRGEVIVGDTQYLVDATNFEKLDECHKGWKPSATFKNSCYQSFSCEENPCLPPTEESGGGESGGESGGSEESPGSGTHILRAIINNSNDQFFVGPQGTTLVQVDPSDTTNGDFTGSPEFVFSTGGEIQFILTFMFGATIIKSVGINVGTIEMTEGPGAAMYPPVGTWDHVVITNP